MKGAPFLGGIKPNLADLSAFGVLRAVQHTPTFEDAMTHSKIKPWFERMEQQVRRKLVGGTRFSAGHSGHCELP